MSRHSRLACVSTTLLCRTSASVCVSQLFSVILSFSVSVPFGHLVWPLCLPASLQALITLYHFAPVILPLYLRATCFHEHLLCTTAQAHEAEGHLQQAALKKLRRARKQLHKDIVKEVTHKQAMEQRRQVMQAADRQCDAVVRQWSGSRQAV